MIKWQKIETPAGDTVGAPGDLPPDLVGLSEDSLADLSWTSEDLNYRGFGFLPVETSDPTPRVVSTLAFLRRIPAAKRVAIMQAAAAPDYAIQALLQVINAATHGVELDHPDTINGLAYAKSKGLLTDADVAAILA